MVSARRGGGGGAGASRGSRGGAGRAPPEPAPQLHGIVFFFLLRIGKKKK